jgi:hypothetical protein
MTAMIGAIAVRNSGAPVGRWRGRGFGWLAGGWEGLPARDGRGPICFGFRPLFASKNDTVVKKFIK